MSKAQEEATAQPTSVTADADDVKPAGANGSNEQSRVERKWEGAEEEEGEHEVEEADDREAPQTLEVLSETYEGASVAKSAAAAAEQLLHLEAEQDEEERLEAEEFAAVIAAAGAEIDAFLSEAQSPMPKEEAHTISGDLRTPQQPAAPSPAETTRRKHTLVSKERVVVAAVAQYDRAKAALGALTERVEAAQYELEHLSKARDDVSRHVDGLGGPREPSAAAAAMGQVPDEEMNTLPRRRNLTREAGEYSAQIDMHHARLADLNPRVDVARRHLTDAENEVASTGLMRAEVAAEGEGAHRLLSHHAARSIAMDKRGVAGFAGARHNAEMRRDVEEDMARGTDDAVVAAAIASRAVAHRRLSEGLATVRANLEMCDADDAAAHRHDVRRLLNLKTATESAFDQLSIFVDAKRSAHTAKKISQRQEAVALLASGVNPHAVFRGRDEGRRVSRAKKVNAESHEARVAHIRQRLVREEALHRKDKDADRARHEHLEHIANNTGNSAREARVKKYMQANIRDGRDVLDPTGRRPVHPSSVSTAKPHHFGLGLQDDHELTEIVARKHPGTGPELLLMTEKEKELSAIFPERAGIEARIGSGPRAANMSKEEEGLGLEDEHEESVGGGRGEEEEEEDFVTAKRRKEKMTMNLREACRLKEKSTTNLAEPGRLYATQVACGREFKGDAFIPTPGTIVFRDFEVGKKYKQRFSLTNVSYASNTFKVMDMDLEVRGLFDVEYDFPGRMSAGMSSEVFLTFTPRTAAALVTTLPLSTNTGVVHVRLECYPSSADVFTSTPVLDFDAVTVGESSTLKGELVNTGASPVPFTVLKSKPRRPDAPPSPITVCVRRGKAKKEGDAGDSGVVPGYSTLVLTVKFDPAVEGRVEEDVVVRLGEPLMRDVVIAVRGVGGPVPVHLDGRDVMDFRTVALGCSYRDALVVHNRGSSAAKCLIKLPHELRGFVEVVPDMIFCQAKSSAVFSLKLSPGAETAGRCAKHVNPDTGALEVSLHVQVPGQAVPVDFTLKALLTTSDLTFDPPKLDFGSVYLGETSVLTLRVTNHSLLLQQYGFVGLPKMVQVRPSPFGEILSNETIELEVAYAPPVVAITDFKLTLKSLLGGRVFHIPCKARGVQPSLQLSANLISLPPTAEREMSSGSIFVKNKSKHQETFEIVVPAAAGRVLKVSPHVGVLAPGERMRVQVEFCPESTPHVPAMRSGVDAGAVAGAGEDKDEDMAKETAAAVKAEKAEAEAGSDGQDGEDSKDNNSDGEGDRDRDRDGDGGHEGDRSGDGGGEETLSSGVGAPEPKCAIWRLPLFIKATDGGSDATALPGGGREKEAGEAGQGHGTLVQHLEVRTVTHASAVVVDNLPELEGAKEMTYTLDFGPIAVGEQRVRGIILRNLSEQVVDMCPTAPDHEGVFSILTAFRPIESHGKFVCKLNFTPHTVTKFCELVTIHTSLRRLRFVLTGEGISPALDVEPAGVIDVGDVAPGDVSHQTMTVTNPTQFVLKYQVRFRDVVAPGSTARSPFVCSPAGGAIDPGASASVTISFSPDRAGRYGVAAQFTGIVVVSVPGLAAETVRPMRARCWADGVYIVGGDDPAAAEASAGTDATVGAAGWLVPRGDVLRESTSPPAFEAVNLTLPTSVRPGGSAAAALEVGSLKGGGGDGKGANGEWSFEDFDEESRRRGWSCDASKGTVEAGRRKSVTFTFAPPKEVQVGDLAYFGLGEWMQTVVVARLKGGVPAPAGAEGREVRVTVRCYLEPEAAAAGEAGAGDDVPAAAAATGRATHPKE